MADLITTIGVVVTGALGWMGQVVTAIMAQPILTLSVVIGFVGVGIGYMKRIMN